MCAPFCILNSKCSRGTITGTNSLEEYCSSKGKLPGEYVLNGVIIPEITNKDTVWGTLILLHAYDIQIVIISSGMLYIRAYVGYPQTWSKWKRYSYTVIS